MATEPASAPLAVLVAPSSGRPGGVVCRASYAQSQITGEYKEQPTHLPPQGEVLLVWRLSWHLDSAQPWQAALTRSRTAHVTAVSYLWLLVF